VTFTPLLRAPAIVQWHIAGALVALAPGTAVLFMRKGTRIHRRIGWFWVGAMFLVAITSFWITGIQTGSIQPDPSSLDPNAGDASIRNLGAPRRPHHLARAAMISLYVSLVAAGAFTLLPNRLIGRAMFGG
jgi:uncharacterized membrane protein